MFPQSFERRAMSVPQVLFKATIFATARAAPAIT
jgi:hypothetical protein